MHFMTVKIEKTFSVVFVIYNSRLRSTELRVIICEPFFFLRKGDTKRR